MHAIYTILNTKIMPNNTKNYEFREVGGIWQRVDSQCQKPPTLAEFLEALPLVIDDSTEFCRIKRNYKGYHETIEYRAYGGTIRITRQTTTDRLPKNPCMD